MINFNNYLFVSEGTQIYSVDLSSRQLNLIATLPNYIYSLSVDFVKNKIYAVTNPSLGTRWNRGSFDLYEIDSSLIIKKLFSQDGNVWRNITFDYKTNKLYIPIDRNRNVFSNDAVLVLDTQTSNSFFLDHTEFYSPTSIYLDDINNLVYIINNTATGNLADVIVFDRNSYEFIYDFRLDSSTESPRAIGSYKNKLIIGANSSYDPQRRFIGILGKIVILDTISKSVLASFDNKVFFPSKIIIKDNLAYIYANTSLSKQTASTVIDLDTNLESTYFVYRDGASDAVINNATKDIYRVKFDYDKLRNIIYKNNTEFAILPTTNIT